MMTFDKEKTATVEIPFIANGNAHTLEIEMKPMTIGEWLEFGINYPNAYGFLMGTGANIVRLKVENGKTEKDYTEVEALLKLAHSKIVSAKLDNEDFPTEKLEKLPDFVQAQLISHFKIFNFFAQGDTDFFAKLEQSIGLLPQSQER